MVSIKNTHIQGESHMWHAYCLATVWLIPCRDIILRKSSINQIGSPASSNHNAKFDSRSHKHSDVAVDSSTRASLYTCCTRDDKTNLFFVSAGKRHSTHWEFCPRECLYRRAYAINGHVACIFFRNRRTKTSCYCNVVSTLGRNGWLPVFSARLVERCTRQWVYPARYLGSLESVSGSKSANV